MIVLIIYIIFAIINLIICLILTYLDYNDGEAITLRIIGNLLLLTFLSILGTIYFILCLITHFFNEYSDTIILQKKEK